MKFLVIVLLFFAFISFSSGASTSKKELPNLNELNFTDGFKDKVVHHLYPSLDQWSQSSYFKGEKGLKIYYRIYGKKQAHTTPVIIVPGFTESSIKYLEVAYDLIQHSFSPIYVIDHRNQGASERAVKKDIGYVEDFSFYLKDLQHFIDNIVKVNHPHQKPYLLAHSMGGLISLLYLQNNPTAIDSAVLSSPLMRIKFSKAREGFISVFSFFYFSVFKKSSFSMKYKKTSVEFNPKNNITHDIDRFQFNKWLDLSQDIYINRISLNWTKEAIKNKYTVTDKTYKIKTNVLILTAEKESIVDNKATQKVCKKITSCSSIPIAKAKHEILMEKNETREKALNKIIQFFNNPIDSSN